MQKICVFSPNRKFLHFLAIGFGGSSSWFFSFSGLYNTRNKKICVHLHS